MILRLEFNTTSPASASQRTGGDGGKVEGRGKGGGAGRGRGKGSVRNWSNKGQKKGAWGGWGVTNFSGSWEKD